MATVGTAPPPLDLAPGAADERVVRLRLALGDVRLGAWALRLRVDGRHSSTLPSVGMDWAEPLDLPKHLDGTLVRAQPVECELPCWTRGERFFRYVPRLYDLCSIDLTTTFEAYVATFSSKSRSTLRRKVRRFEDASGGLLDFREARTPEDFDAFLPLAATVSSRTYQARLLDCGLPEAEDFRVETEALARRDAVRGYLLCLNGEPAAYLYCPVHDGIVTYAFVGHDPRHAELSPGTVLLYLALERLFGERRYRLFDFTEGDGAHKRLFATHTRRCADVYVLRRSRRTLLAARLHRLCNVASSGAGALLERCGAKSLVRRWLRGA